MALAATGDGEEQRTAALLAVRMIHEHRLLDALTAPVRSHAALRGIARDLALRLVAVAYAERRSQAAIAASRIVDEAIAKGALSRAERERGIAMLSALGARLVKGAILVGVRGRAGGYRLAPGVTKKDLERLEQE